MSPANKSKKERIKVGTRVQLKNDLTSDGRVIDKNAGRGHWKVLWSHGKLKGTDTDQSSKSLRAWQLDLSGVDSGSGSSSDDEEDDSPDAPAPGVDHAGLKRKFEAVAKGLVGNTVEVGF